MMENIENVHGGATTTPANAAVAPNMICICDTEDILGEVISYAGYVEIGQFNLTCKLYSDGRTWSYVTGLDLSVLFPRWCRWRNDGERERYIASAIRLVGQIRNNRSLKLRSVTAPFFMSYPQPPLDRHLNELFYDLVPQLESINMKQLDGYQGDTAKFVKDTLERINPDRIERLSLPHLEDNSDYASHHIWSKLKRLKVLEIVFDVFGLAPLLNVIAVNLNKLEKLHLSCHGIAYPRNVVLNDRPKAALLKVAQANKATLKQIRLEQVSWLLISDLITQVKGEGNALSLVAEWDRLDELAQAQFAVPLSGLYCERSSGISLFSSRFAETTDSESFDTIFRKLHGTESTCDAIKDLWAVLKFSYNSATSDRCLKIVESWLVASTDWSYRDCAKLAPIATILDKFIQAEGLYEPRKKVILTSLRETILNYPVAIGLIHSHALRNFLCESVPSWKTWISAALCDMLKHPSRDLLGEDWDQEYFFLPIDTGVANQSCFAEILRFCGGEACQFAPALTNFLMKLSDSSGLRHESAVKDMQTYLQLFEANPQYLPLLIELDDAVSWCLSDERLKPGLLNALHQDSTQQVAKFFAGHFTVDEK